MPIFTGVGTAIITPFNEKNEVDWNVYSDLIEFQIANGADAIIVCGTTGEAATLTYDERAESVRFVVQQVAGRVPVISGGGSNSTENSIRLCLDGQNVGADGLLCVTPYYNKTTQKGLVRHFTAIANAVDLPIILYNVPGRTGLNMEAETVYELSKVKNIVGIKEASHDLGQVTKIASLCGDNFDLYAGNDNEVLMVMTLGGKGCISTSGNVIPQNLHNLVVKFLDGDIAAARKLQLDAIPLIEAMFCEVNPMPVKYALNLMGYAVGICRLPLTTLEEESVEKIKRAMVNYGLI
ncbi:MAG: 4-hydroxy-tetrahydrodipicolinate synthase [Defluviitaleaceae bacterium]|nr:4-hydroxy-tetrahydrodipicolinate synthase [Defluviitaleaceae bacterium]